MLRFLPKTNIKSRPDYILLLAILFLLFMGIIILSSASAPLSAKTAGTPNYFLFRQIIVGLIPGLILALILYNFKISFLREKSFWIYLFSMLLMALVFIPKIGETAGGARRWIKIFGFSFQPIEFLKIAMILYLAAWMVKPIKKKNTYLSLLLPFFIIIGMPILLLILQPNISAVGMIAFIGFAIYFVSKAPLSHILVFIIIAALAFSALIFEPYRFNRIFTFLNPEKDPLGKGYHIKQSLIAIGSGGIFGKGIGFSDQKFGFLPKPIITDSIFPVFAEETGFFGSLMLLICYGILIWRGFKTAKDSTDEFSRLTAIGITSWIGIQTFINLGAMMALFPLTGVPLPFLSYGSSALVCELAAMGILLNISKNNRI